MQNRHFVAALLGGTIISGFWGYAVEAADFGKTSLPAVSAVNGKIEAGGGFVDLDDYSSDELFYGAASLSIPLGESFGAQVDVNVGHAFDETGAGGALHLFTRDPHSYLAGLVGGYGDVGYAKYGWAGGEAELYLDRVSLEFAAGYLNVNPDSGSSDDEFFGFADAALYATDDLRLSVGVASVAKFETANIAAEYLFSSMPVSLKLKGEVGEDGYAAATAGVSFYFGGDEANKSLIRRHREDDPRNRALDIFGAGAAASASSAVPVCPEGYCYAY